MSLAFQAMLFAREVHRDQRRKYSGNPYADHLAEVAGIAMKRADLISNTSSIVIHDPDFATVYLREKRDLLSVLNGADPRLHTLASSQVGPDQP